ncbi:MAG: GlmL-related ornithine degradation protein [Bacillota bacterium]|jgi:uncharacterized protein (TIGR01319 family)
MRQVDILVAEIGSTTTVVNAFSGMDDQRPVFVEQGMAPTTVLAGDVTIGLREAIADLETWLGEPLQWREMLATSSAAGGLRMSVHGLVYDMTVRAAQEAALGAGAILKMVTAGVMQEPELDALRQLEPNIILLAGGVEHGDQSTVVENARRLARLKLAAPIIYAGNSAARPLVQQIFAEAGIRHYLVENVYPRIDELNVEPTRRAIQQVFEEHIVQAPGMEKIRELLTGPIMPTPGAVMEAARLLQAEIGDLLVFDVGGATTDVHSVTPGSDEIARLQISPEPVAKRTVEGDLGVFVNARHVAERIGLEELSRRIGGDAAPLLKDWGPLPRHAAETALLEELTREALETALGRHVGQIRQLYGPTGRLSIAEGKDLTAVRYAIGTGGPLTRLERGAELLQRALNRPAGQRLLPKSPPRILIDRHYNMAVLGVLSRRYPQAALCLLQRSLGLAEEGGDADGSCSDGGLE